jgi:sterol desaturase/sphingolipid hydroxylase (fatty acid hydroxylase superfamily)
MFWIHSAFVGRLPFPLEYILNTPSAHRMHHRPPGNCNYAGRPRTRSSRDVAEI